MLQEYKINQCKTYVSFFSSVVYLRGLIQKSVYSKLNPSRLEKSRRKESSGRGEICHPYVSGAPGGLFRQLPPLQPP